MKSTGKVIRKKKNKERILKLHKWKLILHGTITNILHNKSSSQLHNKQHIERLRHTYIKESHDTSA